MRSRLTPFFAAAMLIASCGAANAYSGALLRPATLYAAPAPGSPVVARIPANAQVDVGPCRAYCLVSYGDVEGYVASSAILAEAPAPYQPEYRIGIFGLVF